LCIEAYKRALENNQPWNDGHDDNVSSIRGLEDLLVRSKQPQSTIVERRRKHVRAVLEAQEKLKLEQHWTMTATGPMSENIDNDDNDEHDHNHEQRDNHHHDSSTTSPELLRRVSMTLSRGCVAQALRRAREDADVPQSFLSRLRRGSSFVKQQSKRLLFAQQTTQES
jgi:hypothetical protein